jgi:hypothetical protein
VDPDWYATVLNRAGSTAVVGFDDLRTAHKWVPFTFTFNLAPGEQIIGATLSLGLRWTGSVQTDDRIYLNSLSNSYRFDDLGWTPMSKTEGAGRVIDLGSSMDLSQLQAGLLNVAIQDDTAVDWATLDLKVVNTGTAARGTRTQSPAVGAFGMGQAPVTGTTLTEAVPGAFDNREQDVFAPPADIPALSSVDGVTASPNTWKNPSGEAVTTWLTDRAFAEDLGFGLLDAGPEPGPWTRVG